MESSKKVGVTEVVLRDGIQSLLATRVPLRDLVSILPALDRVGYWSLETWGGATYDACIRYLNEDPWERLRTFQSLLTKTPQQMLIRGQNLVDGPGEPVPVVLLRLRRPPPARDPGGLLGVEGGRERDETREETHHQAAGSAS